MGVLKSAFHEVISGEYGAVEGLRAANLAAWDAYRALLDALPVYRNAEQERTLSRAHSIAESAKWRYETARDWERYHERERS